MNKPMKLSHGIEGLRRVAPGSILSIGNFDGVHRGHQRLLELGRALRERAPAGARLVVVTFEPHPFTVLRPDRAPPRLTPASIKRELLAEQGLDELVELAPEPAVLNLSAEQFWMLLRDEVKPAHLIEGGEFTFGKDRAGNIDRLHEWSAAAGVQLHVVGAVEVPLFDLRVVPVSSTLIRWLLINGRARDAAVCLGRTYVLRGEVVTGHQRGRQIGVPTANLRCDAQLIPADGVYIGRCAVDGIPYPAALSIGTLPTFGDSARQIEAHLIGFSGDLYGRTLNVEVTDWLRDQWKFQSVDALKQQIALDLNQTVARAGDDVARPVGAI
jgi:riboflavin kinase/FMN adenylyltransferase